MNRDEANREYVVPRYRAVEGDAWFHFLHGNVPGHEIDFMYRPEVPQGALSRQHFSHLARLMRYIEPRDGAEYAFTIGNLSRGDTQHEPGHGGVALIFGLRIRGATDHAGRPNPPFSHGIAAIDRALDAPALLRCAAALHHRVLGGAASAEWYRSYVRSTAGSPAEVKRVLADYVAGFDDLPRPEQSGMSLTWTARGVTKPGSLVFVYPDDAPFEVLASAASRLAAVLYRSDVRWSAISNGREADLANGTTVRFLPESAVGRGETAAVLRGINEIPEDEDTIARELFGAVPVHYARPAASEERERHFAGSDAPVPSEPEIPITIELEAPELEAGGEDVTEQAAPSAGEQGDSAPVTTEALGYEDSPPDSEPPTLVNVPRVTLEQPAAAPLGAPVPERKEPPEPAPPDESHPPFGRSWKKAAAVAGSFLAGVVALLCSIPAPKPAPPPPPAPALEELSPAPVSPVRDNAAGAANAPATGTGTAPPASPPDAAPARGSKVGTLRPTAKKRCVVYGQKPCF